MSVMHEAIRLGTEERAAAARNATTKVVLVLAYAGLFLAAPKVPLTLDWLEALFLVGAVSRLGRLTAHDRVFEPFRRYFTATVPAETAGEVVVARGRGARRAIGELLSCPICAGTWIAAGLVLGLAYWPGPFRLFTWAIGAAGLSELLVAVIEYAAWTAEAARKRVGR